MIASNVIKFLDKIILNLQFKIYCYSVFFNRSFFSAMLENSEHDNQSLMAPDQISDVEWTAGPNMNWVMSQSISVVYYSACVLHASQ